MPGFLPLWEKWNSVVSGYATNQDLTHDSGPRFMRFTCERHCDGTGSIRIDCAVASRRNTPKIFIVRSYLQSKARGDSMAKNKIKAYSPNVLDYPSNMSLWERESLAAEAKLAAEKKSKKKPSTKNLIFIARSTVPE